MSRDFNKAAKGAVIGAAIAAGATVIIPGVAVLSTSMLMLGGAIGGYIGYNKF